MKVPFLDLKTLNGIHKDELFEAIRRTLESGWYVLGQEVEAFERAFAEYCEAKYAVGVANGLDALILSLHALGVGPGDEVLVPSNTYIATWLAVSHVGATPVPVDPLETTCNLDPSKLRNALTPRTRAVVPVHLYGQPADLAPILSFAQENQLFVVEDAAQAHGASYQGKRIGSHGHAVCWSFYPGKNLGAIGDGGAITTDDESLADRLRILRNYGSRAKYHNEVVGWNSRLDEIQAAMLRVKLKRLDDQNARRAEIARHYTDSLRGLTNLRSPQVLEGVKPVWHLYVVRHPQREELASHLASRGIGTMIHYPIPPQKQPAYSSLKLKRSISSVAEEMSSQILSLPISPTMTDWQTQLVVDSIKEFKV